SRQPVSLSEEDVASVKSWVLHEDPHVLALNKPAGLSSQGGRIKAHTLDDLLWAFMRSNGKRPELVHRLDRDTSGVILAAKTKPAAGFLGKAPQMRRFRKTYRTLSASEDGALVELEPLTGRMHQLRVHMAHVGRPLVGDPRYGGALTFAGRAAPRLMLHAAKLTFPHPEGGERTVEAPLPADFEALRQAAEL